MFKIDIRGTEYTAKTLAGISAAYCKARDESGEGASTFPFPDVRIKGRDGKEMTVARMSYNGRVWPNVEYDRQIVPLYDPAADPVPVMLSALNAVIADAYKDDDGDFLLYRQSDADGKEIGPPLAIVAARAAIDAATAAAPDLRAAPIQRPAADPVPVMLSALQDAEERLAEVIEDDPDAIMFEDTLDKVRKAIAAAESATN